MTRLIFLGPPGAGKGTQAVVVAGKLQLAHISTGDLLRAAVAQQTPLGVEAQGYMDRGELVPDSLVLGLVRDRLQQPDTANGWILDGFPRNRSQAEDLNALLAEIDQQINQAVNLDVPDPVIIERMLARGRADDNEAVIRRRLEVYREQTAPLINFFRDRQQLLEIDGNAAVEVVTDRLVSALKVTA
ncbi:adenylate kinase [Synechococcus elongatus]|uniref:adenylate kinase n=1 Tax=Synechococcus elongatus TaxID=32046 RepID=UPI0030CF9157